MAKADMAATSGQSDTTDMDPDMGDEATRHQRMASAIRALSMDAVEAAKSGHPGMPMGTADIATVLFSRFMKFDPTQPDWPDRDRFVLSAGHGSMLIYSLLYLLGYDDMPLEQLKRFRQLGAKTAGHPEHGVAAGIETTTGPLGQGLGNAVGMALAEELLAARFGREIVDHRTFVLASDGDLMEGISHESISLAGHLGLSRLIVLYDDNDISIDGPLDLAESGDAMRRFEAAGWDTARVDGHDPDAIATAIKEAIASPKPSLIACKTTIGYAAPTKAGTAGSHGAPLGDEEIAGARAAMAWPHEPFEIPSDVLDAWRLAGIRQCRERKAWEGRIENLDATTRGEFERALRGDLPAEFKPALAELKKELTADPKAIATRKASETVLATIVEKVPEVVGGSADLSGSNNTKIKDMTTVAPGDFSGRYIHYGVREHAMAAAMNGMVLHKGVIPYGGTFLVFSDYCRPSIRLAALMGLRSIFVLSHDSIGLGEDGPTHQPVEHLASLRAMPRLQVFRPADAVETAECWELALKSCDRPSILALTRQNVGPVRTDHVEKNKCARGAYELIPSDGDPEVSLFATGSEVTLAVAVHQALRKQKITSRVVSIPCFELFAAQPEEYRQQLFGNGELRVGIEAGVRQGWDALIGTDGLFFGVEDFGMSAPYKEIYAMLGLTPEDITARILGHLNAGDGEEAG